MDGCSRSDRLPVDWPDNRDERACFSPLVTRCVEQLGSAKRPRASADGMNPRPTMIAIVPDAYGGRGGIAQYNRDFLGALVEAGFISSIVVLPRNAPDPYTTPKNIRQTTPQPGRVRYAIVALQTALL